MPVLKRSETLKYTVTTSGEPYQDAVGNWITPDPVTVEMELPCRSEANDKGRTLVLEDGTAVQYGFIVYLDPDVPAIPHGMPVSIYQGSTRIGGGRVKRFHPWQKYSAVWV